MSSLFAANHTELEVTDRFKIFLQSALMIMTNYIIFCFFA